MSAAFDTLKFVEKLEAGGFTPTQARAAARAFAEATGDQLATKADLKVDLHRWRVVTQLALAGFIFAAMRFVK